MTEPLVMSHDAPSPFPMRDAALRMIAATEYYMSTGHLPPWARAELATWSDARDAGTSTQPTHVARR